MRNPNLSASFAMKPALPLLFVLSATSLLAASPLVARAAGQVEVNYIQAERFIDIGQGSFERERNQGNLNQVFQRLAKQLPDGQTLKLDVLEVDLAGEVHPGSVQDYRIMRGGVDWPRIKLRYTLQAGDQTLKSGEQYLSDMNYLFPARNFSQVDGPLPYEQRMIARWFTDTFTQP